MIALWFVSVASADIVILREQDPCEGAAVMARCVLDGREGRCEARDCAVPGSPDCLQCVPDASPSRPRARPPEPPSDRRAVEPAPEPAASWCAHVSPAATGVLVGLSLLLGAMRRS